MYVLFCWFPKEINNKQLRRRTNKYVHHTMFVLMRESKPQPSVLQSEPLTTASSNQSVSIRKTIEIICIEKLTVLKTILKCRQI